MPDADVPLSHSLTASARLAGACALSSISKAAPGKPEYHQNLTSYQQVALTLADGHCKVLPLAFSTWPGMHKKELKRSRSGKWRGDRGCQVPGCTEVLPSSVHYFQRHRICPLHCSLPKLELGGQLKRFCSLCRKFQSVHDFDGAKKSCRARLSQHNARRRINTALAGAKRAKTDQLPGDSDSDGDGDGDGNWLPSQGEQQGPDKECKPAGARDAVGWERSGDGGVASSDPPVGNPNPSCLRHFQARGISSGPVMGAIWLAEAGTAEAEEVRRVGQEACVLATGAPLEPAVGELGEIKNELAALVMDQLLDDPELQHILGLLQHEGQPMGASTGGTGNTPYGTELIWATAGSPPEPPGSLQATNTQLLFAQGDPDQACRVYGAQQAQQSQQGHCQASLHVAMAPGALGTALAAPSPPALHAQLPGTGAPVGGRPVYCSEAPSLARPVLAAPAFHTAPVTVSQLSWGREQTSVSSMSHHLQLSPVTPHGFPAQSRGPPALPAVAPIATAGPEPAFAAGRHWLQPSPAACSPGLKTHVYRLSQELFSTDPQQLPWGLRQALVALAAADPACANQGWELHSAPLHTGSNLSASAEAGVFCAAGSPPQGGVWGPYWCDTDGLS